VFRDGDRFTIEAVEPGEYWLSLYLNELDHHSNQFTRAMHSMTVQVTEGGGVIHLGEIQLQPVPKPEE
jgi:hypothetical protein